MATKVSATFDRRFMRRCLELAARGKLRVAPNPMVGCVIVKGQDIVGEGYHQRFGGAHAEVRALRRAGKQAVGATVYVNLEPCSHHGKTPPCVDAILEAGIRRIVVATRDPNPLVSGRGLAKLRRAGVCVEVGVQRHEADLLNERFFTFMRTGMPFVGIKYAQTLDGYMADAFGCSKWITGREARREGHRLRAEYEAVLVGRKTVVRDNPRLTTRLIKGRNAIRVVIDGELQVPSSARVFDTADASTIVVTSRQSVLRKSAKVSRLADRGVQVCGLGERNVISLRQVLHALAEFGISSVLVEGGSATLSGFLKARLAHRIHCFLSPTILGGGLHTVELTSPLHLGSRILVQPVSWRRLGSEILLEGRIRYR